MHCRALLRRNFPSLVHGKILLPLCSSAPRFPSLVHALFTMSLVYIRPVVPGGARGAMAPPDFGRSVNPISTKGADHADQITLAHPDFQTFRQPCTWYVDCITTSQKNIRHSFYGPDGALFQGFPVSFPAKTCVRVWIFAAFASFFSNSIPLVLKQSRSHPS